MIGGWKLYPRVSPRKTWAGLIGGVSVRRSSGPRWRLGLHLAVAPWILAAASALLALVAQGGDLFELAVKRHFDAKEHGNA